MSLMWVRVSPSRMLEELPGDARKAALSISVHETMQRPSDEAGMTPTLLVETLCGISSPQRT